MPSRKKHTSKSSGIVIISEGRPGSSPDKADAGHSIDRSLWASKAKSKDLLFILEHAPFGIVVNRGETGEVVYKNPEIERITGYTHSEVHDINAALEALTPDHVDLRVKIDQLRRIEEAGGGIYLDEIKAKDGVRRGYKPKVYNSSTRLSSNDPLPEPVDQEKIDHFELGSKGAYMKGHLIVNTSVFDTVYRNFQVQVWNTSEFIPMLELKSAGEAETRGIELDLSAVPTQDLKINLNAAYIDAKFNKFKNADNFPTQTAEEGATALGQDLSGKPMPDSPKFKATIGVEQRIMQTAWPFSIVLGAQYSYQPEALMQADQNPKTRQPAFGILNLNIKAVSWSEKYSLTLFVNNVFDKFYLANAEDFFSGIFGPSANAVIGYPARDCKRYAGLRFNVKF